MIAFNGSGEMMATTWNDLKTIFGISSVMIAAAGSATASAQILPIEGPVNPARFRVTSFATGLNFPQGMVQLADGSILVATSDPNSPGSGYYATTGKLLRLVDPALTGIASGPAQSLYTFPAAA